MVATDLRLTLNLLYFSPSTRSGLADYAREQAQSICTRRVTVRLLTAPEFKRRSQDRYELQSQLQARKALTPNASRLSNRLATVRQILADVRELSTEVARSECRHVLFGSYAEYLAPLWAWRLRHLARKGRSKKWLPR